MASSDDMAELEAKFATFVKLSSAGKTVDTKQMNSKACGKMVKDTLPKEVVTIADASVFPKHKEKGKQYMHVSKFGPFIHDCAHEYAKIKTKNHKLPADDPKVAEYEADFKQRICKGGPQVHEVKESKTGGVSKLTDSSQYTGAHKQRFDESGKGKGIDGREELHSNDGYVGNYKNKGSFDKTTKK